MQQSQPAASPLADFYCPQPPLSTLNLFATNQGTNGATSTVNFQVTNAQQLFAVNPSFTAFRNLAGSDSDSDSLADTFDWGLPFFYGRSVFNAIEGRNTPGGLGPYVAY